MSTPYTRPATEHDVFAMEQIMRDAFEASYVNFMPEQYIREFYDNNEAAKIVRVGLQRAGIVEILGRVCGFVMYLDNTINELWVDPEYQGKGAGRALIEWVEGEYRKRKYPTITLYCYEANTEALAFYKKMRFRRASTFMSKDVPGGPIPVYNMVKMVTKLRG